MSEKSNALWYREPEKDGELRREVKLVLLKYLDQISKDIIEAVHQRDADLELEKEITDKEHQAQRDKDSKIAQTKQVTTPSPVDNIKPGNLELAFIALGVCAQLMKHEQIKGFIYKASQGDER